MPVRSGHGFLLNNEYVNDDDLLHIFDPYTKHTAPQQHDVTPLHEKIHNFGKAPICCEALTAACIACKEAQTVDEYCALHPFTSGCEAETVVLHENEVCYEYCQGGSKINYPDKCDEGLTCLPFSSSLSEGGGCGLHAYTCQHEHMFETKTIENHKEEISDHLMTHLVLGDDWIEDEMHALLEEMTICEKIKYKVDLHPDKCDLQHKYLYKKKGCCDESKVTDSPVFYIVVGAGACCLFMTCAAVAGCAEMQRRKANRLERRMRRLLSTDRETDIMESFWEKKRRDENIRFQRQARYNELQTELYNQTLRSPLIYNEIL